VELLFAFIFLNFVTTSLALLAWAIGVVIVRSFAKPPLRDVLFVYSAIGPVVSLFWATGALTIDGFVNEAFLEKSFIGDQLYTPLINGYSIWISEGVESANVSSNVLRRESVRDIAELQIQGAIIYGSVYRFAASGGFERELPTSRNFFRLDTQTGVLQRFQTWADLQSVFPDEAADIRLEPNLNIYVRYRYGWFDRAFLAVALLPPLSVALFFPFAVWYSRRQSAGIPCPVM